MPRLSELTDYDPMGNFTGTQPTAAPVEAPSPLSNNVDKILNSIFRPDENRLQLWPERLVRAGATAAGEVASGAVPQWAIDPKTGDVHTSPEMVEKAQEVSALAGSGGLASGGGSLNATPSLRPALRHKEKLYKGKPGQEHQDIIPDSLYNDFQKKAMKGEDLADYNFGFVNDKGHFLSREDALKYGIDNGIIDQQAGKFGTLTSTMFADSSKPGIAIEALAKAEKMGFNTKETYYHGTPKDFDNFASTSKANGEEGIFLSKDPAIASQYSGYDPLWSPDKEGARVLPLFIKNGKYKEVDFKGSKEGRGEAVAKAKAEGYDGVILKNHYDAGGVQDQTVVFDPKNIRSKFAKFDKDNTDKLLASDPVSLPPGYELKPVDYDPFKIEQKS